MLLSTNTTRQQPKLNQLKLTLYFMKHNYLFSLQKVTKVLKIFFYKPLARKKKRFIFALGLKKQFMY
jgi:diketogulonate reductase-like aldo/keto reductase